MIVCPYCLFPLVGGSPPKKTTEDSSESQVTCTNCEAVLRVDVTTLRLPNEKKRKVKNVNVSS